MSLWAHSKMLAARLKANPRCLSVLLRSFSSNGPILDIDALLGKTLTKEERDNLKKRLDKMNRDTYKQAMSTQLLEVGYHADQLIKKFPKPEQKQTVSRSALLRQNTAATRTLRHEVYSRAISEGLDRAQATKVATKAVEHADELFKQRTNTTMDKFKEEADKLQAEKDEADEKEQKVLQFASERIKELFSFEKLQKREINYEPIEVDPSVPKFFGNTENALNFFDAKKLEPIPTSYWAMMERRKTDITNLSMGPTNAFEEQIQWTEQGRMWPYPIDNEYLMGPEENIHFSEHIFLDRYLAKYTHLPKTGPVAHFMELVCVGLSKNPYMTLEKKHMHLDSFAEFFSPEQIEKVHRLHEEAEKQAA